MATAGGGVPAGENRSEFGTVKGKSTPVRANFCHL